MDVPTESEDTSHALTRFHTRVHIADIDQGDARSIEGKFVEAVIILVWPYSTLTQEAGFLVAEKDVLLRKTKGQVKITFYGLCAREIAKLKAGVGDTLRTSLRAAHLIEEQDEISTPGKKPGFAIRYQDAVDVEVLREDGQTTSLDYEAPEVPSPVRNGTYGILATPRDTRFENIPVHSWPTPSSTPSFKTGFRLSSNSFPGSFVDPFTEEDGSVPGRGRKRTKFGRHSGAWRLVDDEEAEQEQPIEILSSPSVQDVVESTAAAEPTKGITVITEDIPTPEIPVENSPEPSPTEDIEHAAIDVKLPQQDLEEPEEARETATSIKVPSIASSPERRIRIERLSFDSETMPTPRLQALASPGLSIVSPLISRSQYFPAFEKAMSELDASSQRLDQSVFPDSSPYLGDNLEVDELELHDSNVDEQISSVQPLDDGRNAQAAYFPVAAQQSDEVDLDALQEQIDMDNAHPAPIDIVEDVIEDIDMYGPPVEPPRPVHPDVLYPLLDDLSPRTLGSAIALPSTNIASVDEATVPTSFADIGDMVDLPSSSPPPVTAPLPSLLDNAVRELEFFTRDYEPATTTNETASAERRAPTATYFPKKAPARTGTPRFLDGSVDVDSDGHDEVSIGRSVAPSGEQENVVSATDQRESPQIIEETPISSIDEDIVNKGVPTVDVDFPVDAASPMLVQVGEKTPINQSTLADESAGIISESQEVVDPLPSHDLPLVQQLETPSRRKSQRLLGKPVELAGIYSEYFTPKKAPGARQSSPVQEATPMLPEDGAAFLADGPAPVNTDTAMVDISSQKSLLSSITTQLGYYVHISQLTEYYNQMVDVIAICDSDSTAPERAKSGPKDFHTSLQLLNVSETTMDDAHVTAQIFRPRKNVLPHTRRGDVLVLRSFLVQSISHKPTLLSTDTSAWAVFPCEDELRHDSKMPTIVSGPPIELGLEEEEVASKLFAWWTNEGAQRNPESTKSKDLDRNTPYTTPSRQTRKSRSQLPQPLDLRRSPRKTRQEQSSISNVAAHDAQGRSPSFQPLSPTHSQQSLQSSMAPPAIPAISPSHSLFSPSQLRSESVSKERTSSTPQTVSKEADTSSPAPDRSTRSIPRHTRSTSRAYADAFQHLPLEMVNERPQAEDDQVVVDLNDNRMSTPRRNLSASISETNSISGETTSSQRRRHERRSTSLIHELRDGTQWVDVEDSEVVSVSASESDTEVNHTAMEEPSTISSDLRFTQNQDADEPSIDPALDQTVAEEPDIEQPEPPTTPARRARGRPRKDETQASPPLTRASRHARVLSGASASTVDESATNISSSSVTGAVETRMTRSRRRATEQEENTHELRDGVKYTDP